LPEHEPLLEVARLSKTYGGRPRFLNGSRTAVEAVREVSFTLARGGSLGIVGESGSGKTTVARILMGLERPSSGSVRIDGVELGASQQARSHRARARLIQMVFQDPYRSLDPRQRVGQGLDEIQRLHFARSAAERRRRTTELLEAVGLSERDSRAVPRALSGGQRQRVAIARALAPEPAILVLDEAVSALDVSIQAQILNLLAELRTRLGLSYLVISHDLAVLRQVADTCLVIYRGTVVESGAIDEILTAPEHPYTQRLLASVPRPGMALELVTTGERQEAATGCVYRGRCVHAYDRCSAEPALIEHAAGHSVACWWAARTDRTEVVPNP
jgi:oligopeptide transport system ATP-binding protein